MEHSASLFPRAFAVLLVMLVGCTDSPPPWQPEVFESHVTSISPASPTAFHAPPASSVTAPVVRVLDQYGKPMANVPVHFTVVSGGGYVEHRVSATDAEGRATAGHWVLGAEPGENLVVATAEGVLPVAFMAVGGFEPVNAVYGLVRTVPPPGLIGGNCILYEDGTFRLTYVSGGGDTPISSSLEVGDFRARVPRSDLVERYTRGRAS